MNPKALLRWWYGRLLGAGDHDDEVREQAIEWYLTLYAERTA